jgi:hypothetical protein
MAKVKSNVILEGISGKIGGTLVFRRVNGKTILAKAPDMSEREYSPAQTTHLNKFQTAKKYGRELKKNPELKAVYQTRAKGNKAAYHVAIGDFMNSPKVEQIDLGAYHGQVGDIISIRATDDFQVMGVQVSILAPDGTVLEAGEAVQQGKSAFWIYTGTTDQSILKDCRVAVRAMDRPGNVTEAETVIG